MYINTINLSIITQCFFAVYKHSSLTPFNNILDVCGDTDSFYQSQVSSHGNQMTITFPQRFCQLPHLQLRAYGNSQGDFQTTLLHTGFCGFRFELSQHNNPDPLVTNPKIWLEWNATFSELVNERYTHI